MKLSEAILKGCEMYPEQRKRAYFGKDGQSACALGAAMGAVGVKKWESAPRDWWYASMDFNKEYGFFPTELNDRGMSREDIAGMLMAIGR